MNEKDISLINEAYAKVGTLKESFNYIQAAEATLHSAESWATAGVQHAAHEVWSVNNDFKSVMSRYISDVEELVHIALDLKDGELKKASKTFKKLDEPVKGHVPPFVKTLLEPDVDGLAETE